MSILNFFRKKKQVVVNFNSSDFDENEKLSALLNENAFLKGQIIRIQAEEAKKRQSRDEVKEEQEKIKSLLDQETQLKQKTENPISLLKILKYTLDKKNKKKPIKLTTFDGGDVLGHLEDFALMPDGGFGIVSGGDVIWSSKDINHVFWSVRGVNNFAKERIIPLCINKNGQFTPNVMTEEITSVTRTSDGRFKINKINKKPFYEELASKEEEIADVYSENEALEETISEQQKEIHEKEREAFVHKTRSDKIQSELSMALNKVAEIEMANGQIVRQNMALTSLKEINEGLIESMEKIVNKWSGKIEDKFDKTVREEEWEDLKHKLNWAKQNLPQTIYQMPEKEKEPSLSESVRVQKP